MQFSTIILALAASASAAVLPRASQGSWDVQITTGPEERLYLTAQFKSDSYPGEDYLRSACVEAPHATLPVAHGCDRAAFDFVYDGKNINLTQSIDLPNKMTVFGSAYLPAGPVDANGEMHVEGTVEVTSAIA